MRVWASSASTAGSRSPTISAPSIARAEAVVALEATAESQFTVFGAYGAVTFSALSGLLLHALLPHRAGPSPDATPTPVGASA